MRVLPGRRLILAFLQYACGGKAFNERLERSSLDELKTYLRWQLVHANAFLLSTAFVTGNFTFYSKNLRGVAEQRLRWKRCVMYADNDMGEALGQAFVAAEFQKAFSCKAGASPNLLKTHALVTFRLRRTDERTHSGGAR